MAKAKAKAKARSAKAPVRTGSKTNGNGSAAARGDGAAADGADTLTAEQLFSRVPGIDDQDRAAFRELFTDAECLAKGAETRSERIYRQGIKWVAQALPLLQGTYADQIRYGVSRASWVVELLVELARQRGLSSASAGDGSALGSERDAAVVRARARRKALLTALPSVIAPSGGDRDKLDAASADARNVPALQSSLGTLVALARAAVTSSDPKILRRVRGANLTEAFVDAAKADLDALKAADDRKQLGGAAANGRDSAAVNLVEGRVTLELIALRDALDAARDAGVPLPVLVPDAGVANVLARNSGPKAPKATKAAPAVATA